MGSHLNALSTQQGSEAPLQLSDSLGHVQGTSILSPKILLASLLDQCAFGATPETPGPLSRFIQSHPDKELASSFEALSSEEKSQLQNTLSPPLLRSFLELGGESDWGIFNQDLFALGGKLQVAGKLLPAKLAYDLVSQTNGDAISSVGALPEKARQAIQVLEGQGPLGLQLEYQLSHFVKEVTNPISLAAMAAAGLTFGGTRLATFRALEKVKALPWLTRGLGAHGLAFTAGLGAESAAFVGVGRGLISFTGQKQDWSREVLLREYLGAVMMLGLLKTSSGFTRMALGHKALAQGARGTLLQRAPHLLLPQAAMYGSILGTHHLETSLGWRQPTDGVHLAAGALVTLLQFNAMGRLLSGTLGPRYAELNQDLHMRSELLGRRLISSFDDLPPRGGPQLAAAGVGPIRMSGLEQAPLTRPRMFMTNHGEDGSDSTPPASSSRPSDPMIGRIFNNRYEIQETLGEGTAGVVYKGVHRFIEKKVAIKVLRASFSGHKEMVQRFINEARAASSIGNKHIIDISDFGRLKDGSTYIVMEYLEGMELDRILEPEEPIPLPRLLHITRQLVEGMSAAHRAGIVHRDLKPENIYLVNKDGDPEFVKILDFGLAKMDQSSPLTQENRVFGTPHYMSPEQSAGAKVDHRTDIYAVGVIMHRMASGQFPFDAESIQGILNQHLTQAPRSLRTLMPYSKNLHNGLDAIILKCLAKTPGNRYQSMDELLADLEKLEVGITPEVVVAERGKEKSKRRKQLVIGLSGAAGLGTLAFGLWGLINTYTNANQKNNRTQPLPQSDSGASGGPDGTATVSTETPHLKPANRVVVAVEPRDAHILLDGEDLGTGEALIEVDEGKKVHVQILKKGYEAETITLDGSKNKVTVKLKRKGAVGPRIPPGPRPTTTGKQPAPKGTGTDPGVVLPWD